MKRKKVKYILRVLGVGLLLLGISLGLPEAVFSVQNGLKQKVLVVREDTPVNITLSKNPGEVRLSYEAKVELAAQEDVVATKLYNNVSMAVSISLDDDKILEDALTIIGDTGEAEEMKAGIKLFALRTVDSYPVLLMDRSDFNRQYKAWEVFVRAGDYTLGGWLDDATGRYTALWYGDSYERVSKEMLLEYYGETVE